MTPGSVIEFFRIKFYQIRIAQGIAIVWIYIREGCQRKIRLVGGLQEKEFNSLNIRNPLETLTDCIYTIEFFVDAWIFEFCF
ncbi:hypothetical protein EFP84_03635 [Leptospira kmetyi]|uniref:Uncharacterized protein n=1 Tax=Leptospira kmetyi TaxID=408139 RepID=A0AAD0UMY7_9LEPT|nr:hypothetical protein EFP84_03635 [Leptospira kmetyi]